jgi:hypothetical protein
VLCDSALNLNKRRSMDQISKRQSKVARKMTDTLTGRPAENLTPHHVRTSAQAGAKANADCLKIGPSLARVSYLS